MLGYREKGTLIHCWWACKLVQALWKTAKRCLKKSKQLLHYPATSLLDIYLKNMKTVIQKDA